MDSYGEDGNFKEKAAEIERFDHVLPGILALEPEVLIITGDHSTPSLLKGHSWHPVPVLLSSAYVFGGLCNSFSERECTKGELGIFPTVNLMPLALANALRLKNSVRNLAISNQQSTPPSPLSKGGLKGGKLLTSHFSLFTY